MSDPGPMGLLVLCALGTLGLSKFINMKRFDIKLGKERQFHITKQLVHSFSGYIRISQPSLFTKWHFAGVPMMAQH